MKSYGNVLAFTPQQNAVNYGNVMNPEKNMIYKAIHGYKVQAPKINNQIPIAQPLKPKTNAEKNEELRDLMTLFYKVKQNEMEARGQLQPAFKPDPYSKEFGYIHNTDLNAKRAKLLAVEEWKARTGKEYNPKAVISNKHRGNTAAATAGNTAGSIQQQTPQLVAQTAKGGTRMRSSSFDSPLKTPYKKPPKTVASVSVDTSAEQKSIAAEAPPIEPKTLDDSFSTVSKPNLRKPQANPFKDETREESIEWLEEARQQANIEKLKKQGAKQVLPKKKKQGSPIFDKKTKVSRAEIEKALASSYKDEEL